MNCKIGLTQKRHSLTSGNRMHLKQRKSQLLYFQEFILVKRYGPLHNIPEQSYKAIVLNEVGVETWKN